MSWKLWLVTGYYTIGFGSMEHHPTQFSHCTPDQLDSKISQLVPPEYLFGYLRYLQMPEFIMIDFGSPADFIFVIAENSAKLLNESKCDK